MTDRDMIQRFSSKTAGDAVACGPVGLQAL